MFTRRSVIANIFASVLIMAVSAYSISHVLIAEEVDKVFPEPLVLLLTSVSINLVACLYITSIFRVPLLYSDMKKKTLKSLAIWGTLGGTGVGLIEFPYAILRNGYKIPNDLIIEPGNGLVTVSLFLFAAIVIVPLVEEAYFRGCVYRLIRDAFDPFWGLVVSTGMFTLGHGLSTSFETIRFAVGSALLTYIYHKSNSVLASAIAHSIWALTWYSANYAFIYLR